MTTVEEVDLSALKGKEKTAYKHLLEEGLRGLLSGADPLFVEGSQIVCVGALRGGHPIGVAIGAVRPDPLASELYCLAVDDSSDEKDVEALLLASFEKKLLAKGVKKAKVRYLASKAKDSPIEQALKKQGWTPGNMALVRCHFNVPAFAPLWLHKEYPLPPGCEQFMWRDLTPQEREHLLHLVEQQGIPGELSPFHQEHQIDWTTSIGIRSEEGIAGWMVNLRPRDNLIEYRSFFVFPEHHHKGHAMRLLSQSILLTQKKPPRHAIVNINLNLVDNRWTRFAKRNLLPYAEKIERFYETWKNLAAVRD